MLSTKNLSIILGVFIISMFLSLGLGLGMGWNCTTRTITTLSKIKHRDEIVNAVHHNTSLPTKTSEEQLFKWPLNITPPSPTTAASIKEALLITASKLKSTNIKDIPSILGNSEKFLNEMVPHASTYYEAYEVEPERGVLLYHGGGVYCVENKITTSVANTYYSGDICQPSTRKVHHQLGKNMWNFLALNGMYMVRVMTGLARKGGGWSSYFWQYLGPQCTSCLRETSEQRKTMPCTCQKLFAPKYTYVTDLIDVQKDGKPAKVFIMAGYFYPLNLNINTYSAQQT